MDGITLPQVRTSVIDEARNIRYDVMAYRPLAREEALMMVRAYLSNSKTPKRSSGNFVVTIISTIGLRD